MPAFPSCCRYRSPLRPDPCWLLELSAVVLVPLNVPGTQDFSRSFWVIEGLASLALLGGVQYAIRAAAEDWRPAATRASSRGVPTILYGAGRAGIIVVR